MNPARHLLGLRPLPWLAWLALLPAAAGGCQVVDNWVEEADAGREEGEAPERDAKVFAEQVDAKLRAYTTCRDGVASVMGQTWKRYNDQVNDAGAPKRRREGVYIRGIGSNTFRGCRRILASAPRTPPDMPGIQANAVDMVDAATAFAEHTRTLERYVDTKGYEDDDWAQLAELDVELRRLVAAWSSADEAVQQGIDLRHLENDQLLLGVLEQTRSPLEVASRKLMIHARPLNRCLAHIPTPQPRDCDGIRKEFDDAYQEFRAVHDADLDAADKVFWMSTFENDVDEYRNLVIDFQRKLDRRGPSASDRLELVEGYFSLARDSETLDFDFP